jgi:hypothetical protein
MDPIFFFMDPNSVYEVTFLNQLREEETCAAGESAHDVANCVQRMLAATLGFQCTNFNRKDKYHMLAGTDGTVNPKPAKSSNWVDWVKDAIGFSISSLSLLLRYVNPPKLKEVKSDSVQMGALKIELFSPLSEAACNMYWYL